MALEQYKQKIPSFYIIPHDERKGILVVFFITSGKYCNTTVVVKKVEVVETLLEIGYNAFDTRGKHLENVELDEIVGDIVVYFLLSNNEGRNGS